MAKFVRFFFGALVGGGLGAIIGLLLAPRAGRETRDIIRDEVRNRYEASKEKAVHVVQDKTNEVKQKAAQLSSELEEAGRKAMDNNVVHAVQDKAAEFEQAGRRVMEGDQG